MTNNLASVRAAADKADKAFDDACRPHYVDGRWGAYRAIECNHEVPRSVIAAMNEAHSAIQAFYIARDGDRGFLGSRGL
jgi:hypothetical protein